MIDEALLRILVCPEDHSPLAPASTETVERVNAAIGQGRVQNRMGQPVDQPLEAGLVREDGTLLYPIVEEIPVLLVDEAIPLDQLD